MPERPNDEPVIIHLAVQNLKYHVLKAIEDRSGEVSRMIGTEVDKTIKDFKFARLVKVAIHSAIENEVAQMVQLVFKRMMDDKEMIGKLEKMIEDSIRKKVESGDIFKEPEQKGGE